MRLASAVEYGFPYTARDICWMESTPAGLVQVNGAPDRRASVVRALRGESTLLAVWPGKYRADLFQIDDLAEAAQALGVKVDA